VYTWYIQECLALGFEEELGQLICPIAPTEAYTFTGLREEVSFSAKMFSAIGESWTADICEEVEDSLHG
jgi:hypothetical protein